MSYLIAALTATVLLLILAIQNPGPAEVRFLIWHGSMPLALLLLVTTVLGGLLTVAAMMPQRLRTGKLLRDTEARLNAAGVATQPADEIVPGLAEAAQGIKETEL